MTRSALALSSVALATVALSSGCVFAGEPKFHKDLDVSVAHVDAKPLKIDAMNGSISVAPQAGGDANAAGTVAIHAKLYSESQDRLDKASVHAERDPDGTLHIWSEWPSETKGNEGVTFSVLIPSTAGIKADTSNGSISITNLAGPYGLDTSNGGIDVVNATGDVHADTSNGTVTVNGTPGNVFADTSNGSIRVTGATGPVTADSSNGNIELTLAQTNPGPVIADTSNGQVVLTIGSGFGGALVADTSNGKVRFGPFPAGFSAVVTETDDDTLRATFGTAAHKSRLDTSNGTIIIRPAAGG